VQNLDPTIRNAVRAVIIRDGCILLIRKEYEDGSQRYALPGGAMTPEETLVTALKRECAEEIGTEVEVMSLLHVADWFKPRDTEPPSTRHLVEYLFTCNIDEDYMPRNGHHPDSHQVEVVWIELDRLDTLPLWPQAMADILPRIPQQTFRVYLGTID
jgi:ADP-ribose pyrophosphatase YjhB (NUDIX family)